MRGSFIFLFAFVISTIPNVDAFNSANTTVCSKSCYSFGLQAVKGGSLFKRYYNVIEKANLLNSTTKNMTISCGKDIGIVTKKVWEHINEKVTANSLTFGDTSKGIPYGIVRFIDSEWNSKNNMSKDWRSYLTIYHIWSKPIILQPTVIWRFLKSKHKCELVAYNIDQSDIFFVKFLQTQNVC